MQQVRVNITLDQEVWRKFTQLVRKREKSRLVNELLKKEIGKLERSRDQAALAAAFQDASQDTERLSATSEWDVVDRDGWNT